MNPHSEAITLSHIKHLADDYDLYANCRACQHHAKLTGLKPAWEISWVRRHLRCSRCGSKDCGIQIVYAACGGYSYRD